MTPRVRLLAAAFLAAAFSSCGKVSDPLPPIVSVPRAVSDLTVTQAGYDLELRWTNPGLYVDDTPATGLARAVVRSGGSVVLEVPVAGPGQPQTARLGDVRGLAGSSAAFSIEVSGGSDRFSAPSAAVGVDIVRVPGPPEGLGALVDEGRIAVSWETPLEDADLVTGFRVYRDGAVLGEVAPELRLFEDRVYTEGAEYAYRVVAFRGGPSGVVEGVLPSPISVSATDRTAPAPPGPPSVRQVDGAPLVTWPPSPEADLAGYRIWAGEGAAGPFLPLGGALLATTLYSDAAGGGARTYAVSAVDRSGNESPLSEPAP